MLVKEPFNLTIADIRKLTPYQARRIYFRGKEDDQQHQQPRRSYKDIFYAFWRMKGWKERHIDAKWREYEKEQGHGG